VQNGAVNRVAGLLTLLAITGCGLVAQSGPPSDCGLEGEQIAWEGNASLAGVGLEPEAGFPDDETDFPDDRRGEVYVTEPGPNGLRTYCIVLDRGANEQATHSGEVPEGWNLPDDPGSI
jgi:hypothetical protein